MTSFRTSGVIRVLYGATMALGLEAGCQSTPDQSLLLPHNDAGYRKDAAPDASARVLEGGADAIEVSRVEVGPADAGADIDASLETDSGSEASPEIEADPPAVRDAGAVDALFDGAIAATTREILDAQGPDCLSCAELNHCLDPAVMGGSCEDLPGPAPKACNGLLGTSDNATETNVCRATLSIVFSSQCAATVAGLTPCLCGWTNSDACLAGTADPTGPTVPLYACDLGTADRTRAEFTNQATGAGQASAIVQCLSLFHCTCFGLE